MRQENLCTANDLRLNSGMRWRTILFISLALTVALVAAWYFSARGSKAISPASTSSAFAASGRPGSGALIRRQFFSWQEIESPDYRQYIANLREIGCPEKTIRDIILADVNDLYESRKATEIVTPDQQWWRTETD